MNTGFVSVVRTLHAENGMDFDDVQFFKTESYVGIFDNESGEKFFVFPLHDRVIGAIVLDVPNTLEELDQAVYEAVEEHIESVSQYGEFYLVEEK